MLSFAARSTAAAGARCRAEAPVSASCSRSTGATWRSAAGASLAREAARKKTFPRSLGALGGSAGREHDRPNRGVMLGMRLGTLEIWI
eukprot:4979044-Prymnesium_polylepis.1